MPSPPRVAVSLIMPVWRPRVDWLRRAVRSGLEQRGCSIELVVVDDGCEEPVADLLRDIADLRLRVVRARHGGSASARDLGVAAARGGYLRFVDADDVLERSSTARLLELAGGATDVIPYGDTVLCRPDLRPYRAATCRLRGSAAQACLLGEFPVYHASMLFPRPLVEAVGGWTSGLPAVSD